jgi:hypothetical protein
MPKKIAALALMAALLVSTSSGCIGQMALAGKVGKFNLEVAENKWPRWGVFVLLYVIPVYPIAGAIDLIVINSIEFHTGTNPITDKPRIAKAGETREEIAADGTRIVSTLRGDGSIDFDITEIDGTQHFANLQKRGETFVARDTDGNELASLTRDDLVALARLEK